MKIKISSSFTGVINRGSYENSRPGFAVEVEFETDDPVDVSQRQKELQKICYDNFKICESQAIIERIQKERVDIRFYGDYPSVSSIVNWDADMFLPPEKLQQYASLGNLFHAQAAHFLKTGEWKKAEDIEGTWSDLVIVRKGDLKLEVGGWDFPSFLKKYPVEKMEAGEPKTSHKHKIGGTPDVRKCFYQGKKTLADFKRTPDKLKNFKQIAGYVLLEEDNGEEPYEQLMIIPANDKTEQGFSKPIVTTEVQQYKTMFLKDREAFRKRFGA